MYQDGYKNFNNYRIFRFDEQNNRPTNNAYNTNAQATKNADLSMMLLLMW